MNKLLLLPFTFAIAFQVNAQSPVLTDAFKRADSKGDGKLSADEVNPFLQLQTKIHGADKDVDGLMTFEKFRAHLVAGARPLSTASLPATRLTAGDHTRAVQVGDLKRRYRVHVPPGYDAARATPVVIAFHGGGGNPESMVRLSGLNAKSDEAAFIVVYPYGTGRLENQLLTFNGGGCCGYAMERKIDDVAFTRALLDDLATVVNVDAGRVFATGLSNGGIMSHYVASELSDRIAAIAPVGGPLMMDAPNAKHPVPVMHFHGTADEFAPFKGGYGKGSFGRSKGVTDFRSVEHTIQSWVKANGCNPEPKVEPLPDKADDGMKVTRKTWSGGRTAAKWCSSRLKMAATPGRAWSRS